MFCRPILRSATVALLAACLAGGCAADAELEVAPSTLDFGTDASAMWFTVRNGRDDSGIFHSGVDELSYNIRQNVGWIICSPTSGSSQGEADTIAVHLLRENLSPGVNRGTITVKSTGGNASVAVAASNPVPVCSVYPTVLNFGLVDIGETMDLTFTITNTGSGLLSGEVRESNYHYELLGNTTYSLTSGESQTFTVRFQPLLSGTKTCTIETGSGLCSDVLCSGVAL